MGSLRFLQSRPRRLQNLRWREYLLLAVRLGLLALLALLLARLFWQPPRPTRPAHWALLDPATALTGASLERLRVLQAAGAETRLLAPGFPTIRTPPPIRPRPRRRVVAAAGSRRHAARRFVADGLFAGPAASLRGARPALAHVRVEWVETPSVFIPPVAVAAPPPPALTVLILHDANAPKMPGPSPPRWTPSPERAVAR